MAGIDDTKEMILAQTVAVLDESGQTEAAGMLLDAQLNLVSDSYYDPPRTWTTAELYVSAQLVRQFTESADEAIGSVLFDVSSRHGIDLDKYRTFDDKNHAFLDRFMHVRPHVPVVDASWRTTFAERLSNGTPGNQARRERLTASNPSEDGLVFGSTAELTVYRQLKALQQTGPEDRTFSIVPLPGVRQRNGFTVTPDFLVIGNGRALVVEVDGPYHRKSGRYAADTTRDRGWIRCGVRVNRIVVEDVADEEALRNRLHEDLRRELWQRA